MIITPENMYEFKQGDIVEFQATTDVKGFGRIVGLSHVPMAVIGRGYIVESTDGQFPNEVYPYSHLVINEVMILNHPNEVKEDAIH